MVEEEKCGHSYPPFSVGVRPNRVHRPTDMSRELRTVTTAARARPHLDFTMSILPARTEEKDAGLSRKQQTVGATGLFTHQKATETRPPARGCCPTETRLPSPTPAGCRRPEARGTTAQTQIQTHTNTQTGDSFIGNITPVRLFFLILTSMVRILHVYSSVTCILHCKIL
uniref:Uncharacterized protein n=1 Tax=Xiphophorus maculatus TaxID=8083 RepID=A0A3B5PW98_XIPMA